MTYYHEGNGMDDTASDGWVASSLAYLTGTCTDLPWTDATADSERTAAMSTTDQRLAITIESTDDLRHLIRFSRGIQQVAGIQLTQGEMLDLWGKIGAYFNLAGMAENGERIHEHRYSGQTLRHSHDGGNTPHGYFQHAEDFPQETPAPGETYNGQPFPASGEETAR